MERSSRIACVWGGCEIFDMPARRYELLHMCNLNGKGLEIGVSRFPAVSKKLGFNVHVMDHLDADGLKKKYENFGNTETIEDVDFVWNGEGYLELVGDNRYDYIVTSHVIEHVSNLIQHLKDCSAILLDGGVYALAIPDKRFILDYFKPLTSVGKCIDDFIENKTSASKGTVIDSIINNVCCQDGRA